MKEVFGKGKVTLVLVNSGTYRGKIYMHPYSQSYILMCITCIKQYIHEPVFKWFLRSEIQTCIRVCPYTLHYVRKWLIRMLACCTVWQCLMRPSTLCLLFTVVRSPYRPQGWPQAHISIRKWSDWARYRNNAQEEPLWTIPIFSV